MDTSGVVRAWRKILSGERHGSRAQTEESRPVIPRAHQALARELTDAASVLRSELAATADLNGSHHRFLVTRMGSTGSTWLVKLLNSHPDVFCYHEGVLARIYPASGYLDDDVVRFIHFLAFDDMHDAYKAAGDVGSAWLSHLNALPKGTFTTAILMRHPARLLNTRLKVFKTDKSFTAIEPTFLEKIEEVWGIKASRQSKMDQIFLQDLFVFASQIQALASVDLVIHIGRMANIDYCGDVLHRLTRLHYPQSLIEPALDNPVNRRSGSHATVREILSRFSDRQRAWYRLMLEPVLPACGYSLEEDEEDQRQSGQRTAKLQESESAAAEPGLSELECLRQSISRKERQIARLKDRVEELERTWTAVQSSLGWRLIERWYRLRRTLIPAGTWRRTIFDSVRQRK